MLSISNYHHKNFALRLALKRKQTWTRKWNIVSVSTATFPETEIKTLPSRTDYKDWMLVADFFYPMEIRLVNY